MLVNALLSVSCFAGLISAAPNAGLVAPRATNTSSSSNAVCTGNTADDRSVWCDYDTSTNYYETGPDTGVTVEYWFDIQNVTLSPNGIERTYLTVNGSVPGPTVEAKWSVHDSEIISSVL